MVLYIDSIGVTYNHSIGSSGVLQCMMVLVKSCQTLLEDLWTIWSCCLYVF